MIKKFKAKTSKKAKFFLNDLNLNENHYAIVVNGKKIILEDFIEEGDEIILLPKITGG